MDGMQATIEIRKSLLRQPVIIALTANTMEGDREECINVGMNDYIGKPLNMEELVTKPETWAMTKNNSLPSVHSKYLNKKASRLGEALIPSPSVALSYQNKGHA